ncbi:MAG: zf-HC2 domain-containing protein [Chloroflexi bacterium]|nr:zf-HC2 domain-containing protein [Chloroflexota bacterium]
MIWKGWRRNEHQRIQELFSAYLDERLPPAERAQVDAHLRGCTSCARELETLRQTVDWVHRLPPLPLPRDFAAGLIPSPSIGRGYATLRGATALAAAVFVCMLSIDVGSQFFAGPAMFFPAAPAPAPSEESRALEVGTPAPQAPYTAAEAPTPQPTETAGAADLGLATPPPTPIPTPAPIAPRVPGMGETFEGESPFTLSPLRALEILALAATLVLGTLTWRRRAR